MTWRRCNVRTSSGANNTWTTCDVEFAIADGPLLRGECLSTRLPATGQRRYIPIRKVVEFIEVNHRPGEEPSEKGPTP